MREFKIRADEAGQRFDKYLKKLLKEAPDSFIYRMLRKKNITLNGHRANGAERLEDGDEVKLFLSDETFGKFSGNSGRATEYEYLKYLRYPGDPLTSDTSGKLPVVYEDDDILIIDKPSGMLSQKAKPADISANEYILSYLIGEGALTEEQMNTFRPSVCNRLDRNTSGLLIAGKTLRGLQEMSNALRQRKVQKYYRCIVKGEVVSEAHLAGWLTKDEKTNTVRISLKMPEGCFVDHVGTTEGAIRRREACPQRIETEYRPIAVGNGCSELEVHLITGRTHQIRAHLSSVGHPIIGDVKYGDKEINERFRRELQVNSQLLHAYRMVFADGREVTAPCGAEFERVRKTLML